MDFNYEVDTAIDPDDLVEEWLGLSSMFFNYQKELAKKEKEVKDAHEDVKVTRSRLVKEAKEDGAKNDAEREAYYRQHPDHQEAKKKWIDSEYERDLVKGAIGALYRKETAMLEVGKLVGRIEHFRHPKEPVDIHGGKRLHDQAMGRASEKQMDRLNKNRKPRRSRRKE
jgi:hypothetical protein